MLGAVKFGRFTVSPPVILQGLNKHCWKRRG